ncbi:hypothetical protein [Mycolicibacterium sp. XJ1819]
MRIEIASQSETRRLFAEQHGADDGILSFPTTACVSTDGCCPNCRDCYDDCVTCALCKDRGCPHCEVPDLTPRTANMLVIAGVTLGAHAGEQMLRSRQPVFMDQIVRAFEALTDAFRHGRRPVPGCLLEQLCLHLMIAYGTELACGVGDAFNVGLPVSDYDYDFDRLYDTLLADEQHLGLLRIADLKAHAVDIFDFADLGAKTSTTVIERLLTPFDERVG